MQSAGFFLGVEKSGGLSRCIFVYETNTWRRDPRVKLHQLNTRSLEELHVHVPHPAPEYAGLAERWQNVAPYRVNDYI